QWALVRAGRATIDGFLDVADALGDETDYDVLDGLGGALGVIDEQIVAPGSPLQERFRRWLAGRFGPQLERLGWHVASDEDDATRLRRAALVRLVGGIAEAPDVLSAARKRLERYLADRSALDPNLADPVVSLAARTGDEALYESYREVVAAATTPQERRRFLLYLASFRTPATLERTLAAIETPEIPTQDVAFILMRLLSNPPVRAPTCHPMVGLYLEGALYLTTYRKSAKVRNLTADARVACVVVTPDDDPEFRGVALRGRAEILAAGAVMPWTPEAPRPAGTGAGVARLVQSRVAEGKRVVVRLVPDEV